MKIISCTAIIQGKKSRRETKLYYKQDILFNGLHLFAGIHQAKKLNQAEAESLVETFKSIYTSYKERLRTENGVVYTGKEVSYEFEILEA